MNCSICGREKITKYCESNERARESIVKEYDIWKRALEISWKEYLNGVMKNPNTGMGTRDVARNLLKEMK